MGGPLALGRGTPLTARMADMTNDPDSSLLQALGHAVGLAPSYTDFWGQEQHLSEGTLRTLLHAVGMDVDSADALRQTLAQLQERQARAGQALEPVRVIRQDADVLHVTPAARGGRWCLMQEDGGVWEGALEDTLEGLQCRWPQRPPLGYHRLALQDDAGQAVADTTLIVCPERCHEPEPLRAGERWWGPTVQLYALRSDRNWGMGDFTDLKLVIDMAARQGAAFVGLNPLHALFPHEPSRGSPYSPSSRLMLNTLYIDVEAVAEYERCQPAVDRVQSTAFQARLQALREAAHIDYDGVARAKREVLKLLYAHFRREHLARHTPRAVRFKAFQQTRGKALRIQALYDTLQAHFHAQDSHVWGWSLWPRAYQEVDSPEVQAFAQQHIEDVEYAEYLQWLADMQLDAAKEHAQLRGMPLGPYLDVAVGVNEAGAETWSDPGLYALGLHVGAPREEFNPSGQDWGLPPLIPERLRDTAYQPFIDMLRANMRHAGALRLDHVMSLCRLFWVPPDEGAAAGTYMRYPLDDLLGILALESVRHRCLVIGEDLGTVPEGFRETMGARGLLSYCPLYFERRHDGGFKAPSEWQVQALAVVGTHDLPTLRAWWRGDDIETRARLGLFATDEQRRQQVISRAHERVQLLLLLEAEGLWPQGSTVNPGALDDADPRFTEAVYALVGRSRAQLAGVQFEDVAQQLEQVNVPSTTEDQHPNWRVKLASSLEDLVHDSRWLKVCQVLRQARPRAGADAEVRSGLPPLSTAPIPRATYRIQFHAGMRFEQAQAQVPYLARLGVSHLYASPYLKARSGSTHGYDIVDHNALNPEIGSEQDHAALCEALRTHGMHQLLDIVPNHMGVLEADNSWWLDVLECGPASVHACTFDIEWAPPAPELQGKVLLPVLGDHCGRVLESGELQLAFDGAAGEWAVRYHAHRFPLDACTYPEVMAAVAPPDTTPAEDAPERLAVQSLIDAFGRLPDRNDSDPAARALRQRDKVLLKQRLAAAHAQHGWLQAWVQSAAEAFNGIASADGSADASAFDRLDGLLAKQAYRLAFWRVAGDDVNYRRFFDVSTLAALRMETPGVFDATHRTVMQWLADGRLQGLRVDHPDGLADPQTYFESLQQRHVEVRQAQGLPPGVTYIAVEKILADHERVPENWPVHGGTGYRFANVLNGLFVDASHEAEMDAVYAEFIGHRPCFDDILRDAKLLIMSTSLASDLQILTEALHRIAQSDRHSRDFTRNRLRAALVEVAAGFPVYRSYISERGVSQTDRRHVDWACAQAKRHSSAWEVSAIDYLRDVLLNAPEEADAPRKAMMLGFIRRWQQFTAPVMAKAMEDTAFYRYHRLVSLNDVGGDPRRFGLSPSAFHAANQIRARFHPHSMLGTSTHDSKRSEDVRARLNVLSEMPAPWGEAVQRWHAMNKPLAVRAEAEVAPEDEYLLYQTLVGAWPLTEVTQAALDALRERVQAYMLKALREAKQRTSWINPNQVIEDGMSRFIDCLLGVLEPNPFLKDFLAFMGTVIPLGCLNSLNQVVLKLTSPGVPDIYQGCEAWQFNLVDPDNRRPVDFALLRSLLQDVEAAHAQGPVDPATWQAWLSQPETGHIKMAVTWRLLQLRKLVPDLFEKGAYRPLEVQGAAAAHAVAFQRRAEGQGQPDRHCIVIASRLLHGVTPETWQGMRVKWTATGITEWADWLTGQRVPVQLIDHAAPQQVEWRPTEGFANGPIAVLVPAAWLSLPDTAPEHEAPRGTP